MTSQATRLAPRDPGWSFWSCRRLPKSIGRGPRDFFPPDSDVETQQPDSSQSGKRTDGRRTMPVGSRAAVRAVFGFALYGALFFGTAGTFDYWEAWVFMGTLFVPAIVGWIYLVRADPALLERRMRTREKRTRQKVIMLLFTATWLLVLGIPGLDHRFGWSAVPAGLVVFADVVVFASYAFVMRVMLENRYASRTIGVEEGQELVTTGLYALVRHPMYLGILPLIVFAPIALGSWWAMIPALAVPIFLVMRILDEEELLKEDLPGYLDYMQKTRNRLIPGVW